MTESRPLSILDGRDLAVEFKELGAQRLGISTVPEVARAAREHRLRALRGFGEALESRIAEEAEQALQAAESDPGQLAVPTT